MLFQVTYKRFIKEIGNEKINPDSKDKIEFEDLGDTFAYYLSSFDRPKTYVYVVRKDEITDVQIQQLGPLSEPSVRIRDTMSLKIVESLRRIEEQLKPKTPIETQTFE